MFNRSKEVGVPKPKELSFVDFKRSVTAFGLIGVTVVGCADATEPQAQTQAQAQSQEEVIPEEDGGVTIVVPWENNTNEDEEDSSENNNITYEPILMTATTPEELLGQYQNNVECLQNAKELEAQLECVRFLVGDTETDYSNMVQDTAIAFNNIREQTNPNYSKTFTNIEVLDSDTEPGEEIAPGAYRQRFIVVETYDNNEEETLYMEFRRATQRITSSSATELDVDVEDSLVWVLHAVYRTEDVYIEEIIS